MPRSRSSTGRAIGARSNALLEKALELAPESLSYRRTLALRAEADGDSTRALAILRAGLDTENRELRTAVWTDIANYHLERDELDLSIAAFEEALALVEDPPEMAILTHADLLARAGRHDDARRVAKDLDNESFVGLIEARIALDQGRPKEALERLDAVFPVWPNNAGARYYAARAAEQLGDFRRAIDEYRQAIRSAPEQTEAGLRLAKLFLAAGMSEDAWNNAGQYINVHRQDPEGARVLVAAASTDTQVTLHRLLAQIRGTELWPAAVAARARIVALQRGPEAALVALEELPDSTPDLTLPANGEILRERVLLLQAAKRGPEAEKAIEAALAAHPDKAVFLEIHAALLEAKGGDPATVRAAYETVVAQDPRSWRALEGIARALERAGETRSALEMYDRASTAYPESPEAGRRAARSWPGRRRQGGGRTPLARAPEGTSLGRRGGAFPRRLPERTGSERRNDPRLRRAGGHVRRRQARRGPAAPRPRGPGRARPRPSAGQAFKEGRPIPTRNVDSPPPAEATTKPAPGKKMRMRRPKRGNSRTGQNSVDIRKPPM